MTLRHRTLKLGERLDERARERAWFEPPSTTERRQMELDLPNDPEREFVVSIDTAHVRASRAEAGRNFEIVVARAAAADAARAQAAISRPPTQQSASFSPERCRPESEGYAGGGEVTSFRWRRDHEKAAEGAAAADDAYHRLVSHRHEDPPLQQVADHIVRWHDARNSEMAQVRRRTSDR